MRQLLNNQILPKLLLKLQKIKPTVLMYHRILPQKLPNVESGMYVLAETLTWQLKFLKNNYNLIDLASILDGSKLPKNSIALTFDDGWKDNYDFFSKFLPHFKIPLTIFLPTAFINTHKRFWSDLIPELFYNKKLTQLFPELNTLPLNEIGLSTALNFFKNDPTKLSNELLEADSSERLFMNWSEVLELKDLGVDFGNHSHLHNFAHRQTAGEFSEDIKLSEQILLEKNLIPSKFFCYPGGFYTDESNQILEAQGFKGFLKTSKATVTNSNLTEQGRVGIHQDISNGLGSFLFRILVR